MKKPCTSSALSAVGHLGMQLGDLVPKTWIEEKVSIKSISRERRSRMIYIYRISLHLLMSLESTLGRNVMLQACETDC